MGWLGATVLLLIVMAASWHVHPEAPGLVLILVMFGPAFVWGLGLLFGPKNNVAAKAFGLILVGGAGMVLLWGVSLVTT